MKPAQLCHWHAPAAHYLESWSDARAYDGTVSIVQPLIAPLYEGHSAHEIIALLTEMPTSPAHDLVREYWQSQRSEKDQAFEAFWETSLHDGLMAGTALPAISMALRSDFRPTGAQPPLRMPGHWRLCFVPILQSATANLPTMAGCRKLPSPLPAHLGQRRDVSPATAQQLGSYVRRLRDVCSLGGREAKGGVFIVPGHADNSVTLHLGYGRIARRESRRRAWIQRLSAAHLRRTLDCAQALQIKKTGKTYTFASAQHQYTIDFDGHPTDEESDTAFRRDLVQIATLDDFRKNPDFAQNESKQVEDHGPSLYPGFKYDGYAWGMSIDLNRCVGCNACVSRPASRKTILRSSAKIR